MVKYLNDIYIFANNGIATITLDEIIDSTNATCDSGDFIFTEKKDCDNLRFGKIYYLRNNTDTIKYIAESNTLNEEDCFNYILTCGRQKYCGKIYVILTSNKICLNVCESTIGFRGISMGQIEYSADFEINCTINTINFVGTILSAATWEMYNFSTMMYDVISTGQTMSILPNAINNNYLNDTNNNYIRIQYSGITEYGSNLSIAKDVNINNCTMLLQDDTYAVSVVEDCNCVMLDDSSDINDDIISGPKWYLKDNAEFNEISDLSTAVICCQPKNKIQTSLSGYIVDDRFYITVLTNDEIDGEVFDEKTYFKIRYDDEYIEFSGDTICQSCTGHCNYFTVDCYYNDLTKNITLTFVGYGYSTNYFTIETGDTYNFTTIEEDSNILKLRGDALNVRTNVFNIIYNVTDPLCPNCTSCDNFNVIKEISFNTEEDCITLCNNLIITDLTTNICETYLTGLIYIKREVETDCGLLYTEQKLTYNNEIDWCYPETLCNCDGDNSIEELLESVRGSYCHSNLEPPRCDATYLEQKPIQNNFNQKVICGDTNGTNKIVRLEYELNNCGKINFTQNIGYIFGLLPCNDFPCILTGDTYNFVPITITEPIICDPLTMAECIIATTDSLLIEWSGTSIYECYELRYIKQEIYIESVIYGYDMPFTIIKNISDNSYDILDLDANEMYSIWVRGICDKNTNVTTDWYPTNIQEGSDIDVGLVCTTVPHIILGECASLQILESNINCTVNDGYLNIEWTNLGSLIQYDISLSGATCISVQMIITNNSISNLPICDYTFSITPICGNETGITTIKNIMP